MGAACCVAARDKTIQHGSNGEIAHRFRHSPTWSFRWDNRVGVAGEETSTGWPSDVASRNDTLEAKSATDVSAHVSDGGSSLESYRMMGAQGKSPPNQEISKNLRTSSSGQAVGKDASEELKQATESPQVSDPASFKGTPSMYSTPSVSLSPLSSQGHRHPHSSTPTRWVPLSPGHHLAQRPSNAHSPSRDSQSVNSDLEGQTPYENAAASTESTWGSYAFSELTSGSQRGRWSFNSESCSFTHDKASRSSGWNSRSISMDFQTCRICSKVLTEKSVWSSQKIIAGTELSVVAVLMCGHVYHAECLEAITPEINKYDPDCPVCTFGEKQTLKLCEKMLKAEKDLKARYIKKSRNRVVDTDDSLDFDYWKRSPHEGRSPKLSVSSSLRLSAAKPFLKRHFSFGSRSTNKAASGSSSVKKKGLFWAKSSRE